MSDVIIIGFIGITIALVIASLVLVGHLVLVGLTYLVGDVTNDYR